MAGPEATEERAANKIAERRGWLCEKVQGYRNGWPDRLYVKAGRHVWVEWKRDGKPPTPQQALRHDEMREAGMEVHVWHNRRDALAVLR